MLEEVLRKGKLALRAKECRKENSSSSRWRTEWKRGKTVGPSSRNSQASLLTVLQSEGGALQQDQIMA